MALRRNLASLALAGAIWLAATASASAATEVGDECEGNTASGPYSLVPEQHASGGALPLAAPSGGVLTGWKIHSAAPGPVVERLAVFRPTGEAGRFRAVAESGPVTVISGLNVFPARITVEAGDRFGPVGLDAESPLYCLTGDPGDWTWSYPGSAETGSTILFAAGVEVRVPLIAVIEPDADGDGYGDETQDGCPQSAAFTAACPPPVTLRVRAEVRARSILLRVWPSGAASVDAYGQVGWNFKPKPGTRRAAARRGTRRLIVSLDGGTKQVAPGAVTRFVIPLPRTVRLRLSRLTDRESIRAKLTLRATNPVGIAMNTRLRVRLPGRRPAP